MKEITKRAREALRAALLERNEEHGTEFYVLVNEEQAIELAAGVAPPSVRAMVKTMLDWNEQEARKARGYEAVQAYRHAKRGAGR